MTTAIAASCAVVGVAVAGGTYALLNDKADVGGATIKAGSMGLQVNDPANSVLGAVTVNPGSPQVYSFSVTNTGQAKAQLAGAITTTSTSDLKTKMLVNVASTTGTCAATTLPTGSQTIASYTSSNLGTFAAGEKKDFCLYLTVPAGTDAALSGTSIPFTLSLTSKQIP